MVSFLTFYSWQLYSWIACGLKDAIWQENSPHWGAVQGFVLREIGFDLPMLQAFKYCNLTICSGGLLLSLLEDVETRDKSWHVCWARAAVRAGRGEETRMWQHQKAFSQLCMPTHLTSAPNAWKPVLATIHKSYSAVFCWLFGILQDQIHVA